MKKIFLAWKPYCTRSQNIASHFGAKNIYVFPFVSQGSSLKTIARYVLSAFKTLAILARERAHVIFTLNQPIPLILTIYVFTKLFGGKYILDSHSAPFNDPRLAGLLPAYRFLASRALFNINTNNFHKEVVESWGGESYIIADVPIAFGKDYPTWDVSENSIAVVASFMFDEPLETIWEAARKLPDVHFHITGDYRKAAKQLIENIPPNVRLEGFLSRDDYVGLLLSVKGVMVLTTRNFTMQMGAYEALSLEKPIITSDWEILRESFGQGAVYVKNTPESIAGGTCELLENYAKYNKAVILQRIKRKEYFRRTRNVILGELTRLEGKDLR
jgi:glycosyltransferase involved in cell wall biosynthesis